MTVDTLGCLVVYRNNTEMVVFLIGLWSSVILRNYLLETAGQPAGLPLCLYCFQDHWYPGMFSPDPLAFLCYMANSLRFILVTVPLVITPKVVCSGDEGFIFYTSYWQVKGGFPFRMCCMGIWAM